MFRALDRTYISQTEFDEMYTPTKQMILMIQKLANYLETAEIKGSKFKTR
jgi:hypothetical protein